MQHLFQADLNLLMYFGDESPSKPFQSRKLYLVYVYLYIYILCIYIHKYLRMYVSEQKGRVAFKDKKTKENQHKKQGIQRLSICCVNSGTVSARYCCEPREVNGAKPVMKKCRRGNGTKFTAILRKSQFSCPGKRKQQVTPLIAADTKWFRSP